MDSTRNDSFNENMLLYIIDEEFRIVHISEALKCYAPQAECGQKCYETFFNRGQKCEKCPLKTEGHGKDLYYDMRSGEWKNIQAFPIELPGVGKCHIISIDKLENSIKNLFYDVVGDSAYSEFVEFNFFNDSYHVLYHGERNNAKEKDNGIISRDVGGLARDKIHPDDIKNFDEFWCFDAIGKKGVPKKLHMPRQCEVRSLKADGKYKWIRQVMMPCRQSGPDSVFVMFFFHSIEENEEKAFFEPKNDEPRLYAKEEFFRMGRRIIDKSAEDTAWSMISIDLENFKMFNEWYGWKAGDDLLYHIAEYLGQLQNENRCIAGYFGDDDFAVLMESDEEQQKTLYDKIVQFAAEYDEQMGFLPAFGICEIKGKSESLATIYDYAEMARTSIRNDYRVRMKKFDSEMLKSMANKYVLLSDIKRAIRDKEITFFLQPKCNMNSGAVIGAEALVRWISKDKGIISPGAFIPTLEKTGFITMLDTYIWEEVCKWQRSILDRGIPALTVAVNVSRADLLFIDVPEYLLNLVKKYDLTTDLLSVEITESVYTENNAEIEEIVKKLRSNGFKVSMDDFGSGYSSLNMLKDVEVDVLKIDMRFLAMDENNEQKGLGILEAVCNMTRLMGINVIAEGVESAQQKDFLLRMGCDFGQGYYFYRPMPTAEYEHLLTKKEKLDFKGFHPREMQQLYLKDLLSEDMFSEIMINNMLGAVAFFDVCGENILVTRYNEHLHHIVGDIHSNEKGEINLKDSLSEASLAVMRNMFADAQKYRNDGAECDLKKTEADGTERWLRLRTFYLSGRNQHKIYYSSISDVTDIYEKNKILRQQNEILGFLNNDMPGGYYRHKDNEDFECIHVSKRFLDMVEFTEAEFWQLFGGKFANMIHPDDVENVKENVRISKENGGNIIQTFRMRCKSGYIKVIDLSRFVEYEEMKFFHGIILDDRRTYEGFSLEQDGFSAEIIPCGIFQSAADVGYSIGYVDNTLLNLLGYSREAFTEKFKCLADFICAEDHKRVKAEVIRQMKKNNEFSCEFRVHLPDGSPKWVYAHGRRYSDENGKRWFCTCLMDGEYIKEKEYRQEWQQRKYKILAEIPGTIVFDYDPKEDRLTAEIASENGGSREVVSDNFIKTYGEHKWLLEPTLTQKKIIRMILSKPMSTTLEFQGRFDGEENFRWYRAYITSLADENGIVYRIIGRSDNIESEMRTLYDLKNQAKRDPLTGLLSKRSAKELINELNREHFGGTMFVLDIDDYTKIDEKYGHINGDKLLKKATEQIKSVFRKEDVLARIDSDEFMMFIPGACDDAVAAYRAQELLRKINEIMMEDGEQMTCSIGIAIDRDMECSLEEQLGRGFAALSTAKKAGKNRYMFFQK